MIARTLAIKVLPIRTLESSQRDVLPVWPFCRVYSLCQWAVWTSEAFPQGVLSVPVLLSAHAGAQESAPPGRCGLAVHKFDHQKGPKLLWPNLECIWEKSPMSRVGEGGV